MARYFVADLHLGHEKVAGLRGFDSAEAHDDWVISQIDKRLKYHDELFILGDISSGGTASEKNAVHRLCELLWDRTQDELAFHLVLGNHDRGHPLTRNGRNKQYDALSAFDSINLFDVVNIDGHKVMLSHFPYDNVDHEGSERDFTPYMLRDTGRWLIHGHTHDSVDQVRGRQICCSIDYGILSEGDVKNIIAGQEKGVPWFKK